MEKTRLVIFDLDGTLFRTETVDIKAFNRALALNGLGELPGEEILGLIGLNMDEVCQLLLKDLNHSLKNKFNEDVIRFEREEISSSGELYPGVEPFLRRLSDKNLSLCICSNGGEEYVTSVLNKFGLSELFDEIWCYRQGFTKPQAVGELKRFFGVDGFIMVGDRLSDFEAARTNGGTSIGVGYGFGGEEILEADYTADSIEKVEEIIYRIFNMK